MKGLQIPGTISVYFCVTFTTQLLYLRVLKPIVEVILCTASSSITQPVHSSLFFKFANGLRLGSDSLLVHSEISIT